MKRLLFVVCILSMVHTLYAQGIGNVKFGTPREVAVHEIELLFGAPSALSDDQMIYTNRDFEGYRWNEVVFNFKKGKLTEARFFMDKNNKTHAKKEMREMANYFGQKYSISDDIEEDGTEFYTCGRSPVGLGRLFTLFVAPRNAIWTTQLRFGPFKFN